MKNFLESPGARNVVLEGGEKRPVSWGAPVLLSWRQVRLNSEVIFTKGKDRPTFAIFKGGGLGGDGKDCPFFEETESLSLTGEKKSQK